MEEGDGTGKILFGPEFSSLNGKIPKTTKKRGERF